MTSEISTTYSRNGKLNTEMTVENILYRDYSSEKEKQKAISLFEKADKNGDGFLDASEIKAYDKKQAWKTAGIVALSLVGAAALVAVGYKVLKPIISRNITLKQMMNKDLTLMSMENKSLVELEQIQTRYNAIKEQLRNIRPKGTTMGMKIDTVKYHHCADVDDRMFCNAILRHPKMGAVETSIAELNSKYWIDSLERDLSGTTSKSMAECYMDHTTIGRKLPKMRDILRFINKNGIPDYKIT